MKTFDAGDSLGSLGPKQIAQYLTEIGDLEAAKEFVSGSVGGQSGSFWAAKPYSKTGMVIGYIPPDSGKTVDVLGLSGIKKDSGLQKTRIKITLDKFHVASYPGLGTHSILCEFSGKNQVPGEAEELTFALRFEARDGSGPSIAGAPIFMGITVGDDGISFKGRTVNVRSKTTETILSTLNTPAFKGGLTLLTTMQPALKPLASLASAAVDLTLEETKNVQVHNFDLGLDFGDGATSARLRHGSYVVVQTDDGGSWLWSNFLWNTDGSCLQYRANPNQQLSTTWFLA